MPLVKITLEVGELLSAASRTTSCYAALLLAGHFSGQLKAMVAPLILSHRSLNVMRHSVQKYSWMDGRIPRKAALVHSSSLSINDSEFLAYFDHRNNRTVFVREHKYVTAPPPGNTVTGHRLIQIN